MKRIIIAFGLYFNMTSGCTSWSIGVPSATLNVGEGKAQKALLAMWILEFHKDKKTAKNNFLA